MAAAAMAMAAMTRDHRASRTGRRLAFGSLRGLNGSDPPAGMATTPPQIVSPLRTSASNEVLPYAGFPLASEILHITLR